MILKKNKYGFYLKREDPFILESDGYYCSLIENALVVADQTGHTGGLEEMKGQVIELRDKAYAAMNIDGKNVIRSIVSKLKTMFIYLKDKAKEFTKNYGPKIKKAIDSLCNFIMNTIDDIKNQLS